MELKEAWRNAADRFSAAMEGAKSVLNEAFKGTRGRLQKFLLFLLWDGYRTAVSAQTLVQQGLTDPRIPADSVELLTPQILERAILSSYCRKYASAEVVDRFLKTSARQWERSWQPLITTEDRDLPVKQLPDYKQMAEDIGGNLYEIYGKLSYLIHPRAAQPYSLVEEESGLSPEIFSRRRIQKILPVAASLLIILTQNFSDSQSEGSSSSNSSP